MIHVEKHVAHFNFNGELKVAKARFRKTAKLYILAEDDTSKPICSALSWGTRFAQDDPRLCNSPQEALATLRGQEQRSLENLLAEIRKVEARIRLIDMEGGNGWGPVKDIVGDGA